MPDYIPRVEYEARHKIVEDSIRNVDNEVSNIEARLFLAIEKLETKIDNVSDEMGKNTITSWQFIAGGLMSFIAGGGLVGILVIIHVL